MVEYLPSPFQGEGGPAGPGEGSLRPSAQMIERARILRREAPRAEQTAWRILRNRTAVGMKFRRQHMIGHYVLDFYCAERKLAIELDGSIHSQPSQMQKDQAKDAFLQRKEIRVVRVPNGLVLDDPEGFVRKILTNAPSPAPLRGTPSP